MNTSNPFEISKIGNKTLQSLKWSPTRAMSTHLKLVRMFGPLINELIRNIPKGGISSVDISTIDFGTVIASLFKHAPESEIMDFMVEILNGSQFDGNKLELGNNPIDLTGEDSLLDTYKVVFQILKVNLSNFIPASVLAKIKAVTAEAAIEALKVASPQG